MKSVVLIVVGGILSIILSLIIHVADIERGEEVKVETGYMSEKDMEAIMDRDYQGVLGIAIDTTMCYKVYVWKSMDCVNYYCRDTIEINKGKDGK